MATSAEQWVKDINEATNSRDLDQIISLYSDDCIWENVGPGIVCKGKEELLNYHKELFTAYPDFKVELKSNFASGNQVCGEYIMSGTHKGSMSAMPIPPTGKTWSVRSVRVDELKDGKAYKTRVYFDMASILQQLGVMPGPPQ